MFYVNEIAKYTNHEIAGAMSIFRMNNIFI